MSDEQPPVRERAPAPKRSRGMGARVRRGPAARAARASAGAGRGQLARAAAIYALATFALTLPLSLHPNSLSRLDNGDARLNAWAISWVAHQMLDDPARLFDANIFYPLSHTLAFSEHLTLEGLLALPVLASTDDLVLTTNLLLLAAVWATALGMYLLARRLTGSHLAALLAGLFFSFAPFRFNRLPHIQMQLYAFLPLVLWALHRFLDTRRARALALMAVFFVLQALAGTYLGAICSVATGVALVTLLPFARPTLREIGLVALALGGAALVLLPFALPYLWVNRELGIEWDLEGVGSLAATPASYLASSSHLYRDLTAHLLGSAAVTDYLFPGLTLLVLGTIGAFLLARDPSRRPLLLCYGSIFVAGVAISLGPATPVHAFLYEHIVFFRGLRALTRFGLLPLFSLSTLSAFALAWLLEGRDAVSRPKLVAAAIGLFFVAESTALPYGLTELRDEPPEVYRWLASAKPGPIVELPFKVIDTRYMFWARHHGFRPMLNGDSGFVPVSHQWMKNDLARFPSDDAIELLRRLDVRYVVLHLGAFRKPALLRLLQALDRHRDALLPVRDFGRDVVFEVLPSADPPREPEEGPPPPLAVTGTPPALFDGDVASGVRAQGPSLEITVELPEAVAIEAIRLHYGPAPRVPAGEVTLFVDDGLLPVWSTPPRWPPMTELVTGLLATPRDGTQTLRVPSLTARKLRVVLTGLDGEPVEATEVTISGRALAASSGVPAEDREAKDRGEAERAVERDGALVASAHHER